jgi:hypothetical protein
MEKFDSSQRWIDKQPRRDLVPFSLEGILACAPIMRRPVFWYFFFRSRLSRDGGVGGNPSVGICSCVHCWTENGRVARASGQAEEDVTACCQSAFCSGRIKPRTGRHHFTCIEKFFGRNKVVGWNPVRLCWDFHFNYKVADSNSYLSSVDTRPK